MSSVQRYTVVGSDEGVVLALTSPHGAYVLHTDHAARVAELEASLLAEIQRGTEWYDRYMRVVEGLNNEGDPIGGDQPSGLRHRVEHAESLVGRLRGVLEFYAAPASYEQHELPDASGYEASAVQRDRGSKARAALAQQSPGVGS